MGSSVEATVSIHPKTLKLSSNGNYVTCYIELPDEYVIEDIIVDTVALTKIGETALEYPLCQVMSRYQDLDEDGNADTLMVKFDRGEVASYLEPGSVYEITISGDLETGISFEGSGSIRTR